MHSSMEPIFHPLTIQQISNYKESQLILLHPFTIYFNNHPTDHVILAITHTHIYIFQNHNKNIPILCVLLDFALKFQILREEWKDELTPGKGVAIALEKDNCQTVSFYSSSVCVIDAWRIILEEKINQRGFHKLFKAKRKIGKGAFATVYLAERLIDKKLVAVKAFSKEKHYSTEKGKDSLINQINLMRLLRNHPNISNLEGVFETQNSIYVILQNLSGGQLQERMKAGTKFTYNDSLQIMRNILKGLAFMDSHRIIHRDLKPENLLFRQPNSLQLVIADFGLATWAEEPNYLFVRCGTPGFVAPQIINIKDMNTHSDPISDVFSAGLIFHFLLFGHSVFKGTKYAQILSQNRSCDYLLHGIQYDNLDKNGYNLLCRMLEVNPKLRIRAHQALNHKAFQMEIQGQSVQIKLYKHLNFTKQSQINSIYENPIPLKGKQNSIYSPLPKKTSQYKKNQSINLLTSRMNNQSNNA